MMLQQRSNSVLPWAKSIAEQAARSRSLTFGLASGQRQGSNARVLFQLVKAVVDQLAVLTPSAATLLCRLDVQSHSIPRLGIGFEDHPDPEIVRSALGNWHHVEIPLLLGLHAPRLLQQLPRWLPKWKQQYQLIVFDLGPIHQLPSRTVGRWCDMNFILLGPSSCASAHWLAQHINYHRECGSIIEGSIVAA